MLDDKGLYHFPAVDSSEDVPKEPYIRFKAAIKVQTAENSVVDGEVVRNKKITAYPDHCYYMPIGNPRFDTTGGTGIPVILSIIKKREGRGHVVDGFGNFPRTEYYTTLDRKLRSQTSARMKDPNDPARKQIEAQVRQELAAEAKAKKTKKDASKNKQESTDRRPENATATAA